MKNSPIHRNTLIIIGLLLVASLFQLLLYLSGRILDRDIPLGNLAFGVTFFGILAVYYYKNNLWPRIAQHRWVLLFLLYIGISYIWGLYRFRTPTTATFDLWLFAYIPAVLLIPAFSFSARAFDACLAVLVGVYIVLAVFLIGAFPETLYNREEFSHFIRAPAMLNAGGIYLLFKYASRISIFTLVGLISVLFDGILHGVGGAFRGRLILALLALVLFFLILMRSTKVGFGWKFLSLGMGAIACAVALFLVATRFQEQYYVVAERLTSITDKFALTGDVVASDGRLKEAEYFFSLYPNRKLILGHGIGALWYDFYGIFGAKIGGTFAGARTMLHINWLHIVFKIGIVGFLLLLGMLVSHWRKHLGILKQNWGWWAFVIYYCAWTTYYGDKELTVRSIVFLMVLVHPWLFRTAPAEQRRPVPMGVGPPVRHGRPQRPPLPAHPYR
ncbi:MAG: hypothetical protein GVY36_10735 [Verrucomicrobia bacterium]|jgi:hypothetical protein|nr:hypothetical protein [Verrucomicrobiota bacterium]